MPPFEGSRLRCSVVVCTTGDRRDSLAACLESLTAVRPAADELIVVDNTPGDPATARQARIHNATYVVVEEPGLSRARNAGALKARGEVVAFIDDDATAYVDWLCFLLGPFEDEGVAATTGRVLRPLDGRVEADRPSGEDLGPTARRIDARSPEWVEITLFGGIGLGGNMAVRRERLMNFPFREDLGLPFAVLGEEHYLFFQLARAGFAIAYVPDAVVEHHAIGESADGVQYRRRQDRGASLALLVAAEEPGFRWRIIRYGLRSIAGSQAAWHAEGRRSGRPRWRLVTGALAGLLARRGRAPRP